MRLELPASEHPVGDCEQMFLAMNGEGLNAKNSSHEKDWREFPDLQILCDREFGPRSLSTGDLVSIHLDSQNCHFFRVAVIGFVEVGGCVLVGMGEYFVRFCVIGCVRRATADSTDNGTLNNTKYPSTRPPPAPQSSSLWTIATAFCDSPR